MAAIQATLEFNKTSSSGFVPEMMRFTFSGAKTILEDKAGVPYLTNEFWTSKQRDAHPLHEVSYRACFKAQLPAFFIERLTEPGDRVYDPFMGRGTTPLQAALMGRFPVASDVNPLSSMLCRPRLNTPTLEAVVERLSGMNLAASIDEHKHLLAFYHPDTLSEIVALRKYLMDRDDSGKLDRTDDWIRMVAINRLTGHSPGFFSVYSLPPNQAVSVERQLRINQKRRQIPPKRDVKMLIIRKSRSLLKQGGLDSRSELYTGPSDNCPEIMDGSVDLVVTSPPFLDIVQYASDNWLRCWFAGIDESAVDIAMHRKVESWQAFTHSTLAEQVRLVRSGGHIAYEVGEVRGGKVELDQVVLKAAVGLPLRPVAVLVNMQEFTKTANCWGVSNNTTGTNTNRIVLMERI